MSQSDLCKALGGTPADNAGLIQADLSVKIGDIQFTAKTAADFANYPEKPAAQAAYEKELAVAERLRSANPGKDLAPEARTSLQEVASRLAGNSKLSAESRVLLARTQLILGQPEQAARTAQAVMATHPQLINSTPSLLKLVQPAPPHP